MANRTEKNAYSILGIQKTATPEQIKQAYIEQVKLYDNETHIDRFMAIQKAFEKLKNPVTRAKEDVYTFNPIHGEFIFADEEKTSAVAEELDSAIDQKTQELTQSADHVELKTDLIRFLMHRSFLHTAKHQWVQAVELWTQVLGIDPNHRRAKNNLYYGALMVAFSYSQQSLFEEAAEFWLRAVKMDPHNIEIIHNLALAYELAEDHQEAKRYWDETIKAWRTQLERNPSNEVLRNCIIEALRKSTEPADPASQKPEQPKGIDEYQEILKLNPDDFDAHYKLCALLMQNREWKEALNELKTLGTKHPRNTDVLNLQAWALINCGQTDDAFALWRRATVIDPNNTHIRESVIKAHLSMGRLLRERKQFTPSLVHFKALLRYRPNSDEVYCEIGKTYQLKGEEPSALQAFNKALEINPKSKEARNGISALKLKR